MFTAGGLLKIIVPKEKMIDKQPYVKDFSSTQLKLIGIAEILGAIGLILPLASGILPVLTPLAATGMCVIMVLAARLHYKYQESGKVIVIAGMFLVVAFIAYTRFNGLANKVGLLNI
jgi:hypothetical protein